MSPLSSARPGPLRGRRRDQAIAGDQGRWIQIACAFRVARLPRTVEHRPYRLDSALDEQPTIRRWTRATNRPRPASCGTAPLRAGVADPPPSRRVLARDKRNSRLSATGAGETLFIDARKARLDVRSTHRELTDTDIARVAGTYTPGARSRRGRIRGRPRLLQGCQASTRSAATATVLTPGRYVGRRGGRRGRRTLRRQDRRLVATLREQQPKRPASTRLINATCGSSGMGE